MLNKLTNRVYYMDFVQIGDRPVLGLVVGDKYSLIIDGGNSSSHAKEFLKEIGKLNIPPVKYLLLTHWHWDHVFGITTIGALNIVHKNTDSKLKWMKGLEWTNEAIHERVVAGEEIEFCEEHIKIEHPNSDRSIQIPESDIVFEKSLIIDLGGVSINAKHIQSDHSDDCVAIHVKEEGVVFIGDAIYNDMYNGEYSYSREKIYQLLDQLLDYKGNYYIPSHHGIYNFNEFKGFREYIREVGDVVGESISNEEAIKRYELFKGRQASEGEINDIVAFVEGNKKRV